MAEPATPVQGGPTTSSAVPADVATVAPKPSAAPNGSGFDITKMLPVDNQFFTGGLGIAALGFALQVARRGTSVVGALARRHFMMTLEVTSKDASYPWVLNWLNSHGRRTQHLSANTAVQKMSDGSSRLTFEFVPGPGRHLIVYNNWWFLAERAREYQSVNMTSGTPWEKVTLTSVGRNTSLFADLLQEAQQLAVQKEEGTTIIYTAWGTEWRPFGHPRRKRPLESVILDDGIKESILEDLEEWRMSASWYHQRGIPYRRGYLLHGPPGGGKTSFILALAGHLDYSICILSLSEEGMTDDRLAQALSVVPQQSLVLLEDIDAAFVQRTATQQSRGQLTFSGLLNVLDGAASSEERIIFMTTNFLDRLDAALVRPGRVDVVKYLGRASASQVERLFRSFYPDLPEESHLPGDFTHRATDLELNGSMAELQGFLLRYKTSPQQAINQLDLLKDELCQRQQHAGPLMPGGPGGREVPSGKGSRRRITAFEVDKMPFNPQDGWEEMCGLSTPPPPGPGAR